MRISKKYRKKLLKKFTPSTTRLDTMDRILTRLPYPQESVHNIYKHGKKLIRPAIEYFNTHRKYNEHDGRILSFSSLKKNKYNVVTICGFVSNYKLVFNHFYHQVAIYILLKYVAGFTYNNKFQYLTDHMWIDPNLFNRIAINPNIIGKGDFIVVEGKPCTYNGYIGHIHGMKVSLDDADIISSGYPAMYHNHLLYQTVDYNHGNQFIYSAKAQRNPNVIIGNEISQYDRNHILKDKYYIGYSDYFNLGIIIHQGLHIRVNHKNPRLIVKFLGVHKKIIKNIRWTTNQYSIKHAIVLTSAKNYQHHPRRTERSIDNYLSHTLRDSYLYLIEQIL